MLNFKTIIFISMIALSSNVQAFWFEEVDHSEHQTEIKEVNDFKGLLNQAKNENKIIMLEMSASYCGYCRQLENEIIRPMIISGDYENVIIRKMEIDSYHSINLPEDRTASPSEYARKKNIFVTPTLLFLDHQGNEVAERILGVNSLDFYGAYVDEAIEIGLKKLK